MTATYPRGPRSSGRNRIHAWLSSAVELRLGVLALVAALVAAQCAFAQQTFTAENLDQWVFQRGGMVVGRNGTSGRQTLTSQLQMHIDDIDRVCKLTGPQKDKLRLMGQGDIKRFFDGYEPFRQKFAAMNLKQNDAEFQEKWQDVWQEISPFQMSLQNMFNADSLYARSLRSTLTSDQRKLKDASDRERAQYRRHAQIELAEATFEQRMPLLEAQREQLLTLFKEMSRPALAANRREYIDAMGDIRRLPEAKVKPVFDEVQWKALKRAMGGGGLGQIFAPIFGGLEAE